MKENQPKAAAFGNCFRAAFVSAAFFKPFSQKLKMHLFAKR
jgi:hypothetical protein